MKPLPPDPRRITNASQPFVLRFYLVVYNVLSTAGWSYVLFITAAHLTGQTALSRVAPVPASATATSALTRFWSAIPYFRTSTPITVQVQNKFPTTLIPLVNRASSTFLAVGAQTAIVQSFAILEVVHTLLGLVRSPVTTTAMQVASRLILVWGIAEKYESARSNPIYASMVLSWSVTEIIRYSFYAATLLQSQPRWLLWLRYNSFWVLYPLGAGSEAVLIFSTLPPLPPRSGSWIQPAWNGWDYFRGILFLLWLPGLYVMYTYMIQQRKKALRSPGYKLKTP